jgi:glycosyltransferase involved in cell wall biosynthesis
MKKSEVPRISIGLPVFNCEKYVSDCIKSILSQTFSDFELIIINDGSNDSSASVLSSFKDERIILINSDVRLGLIYRLNQLIDLSNGEFFVRMDADDIMLPYRLENQLYELSNEDKNVVSFSGAIIINEQGKIIEETRPKIPKSKLDLFLGIYPTHPTVMAHIDWFRNYKYRSGMFRIEDFDLWYRSFKNTIFKSSSTPFIFYRKISSSKSSSYFITIQPLLKFIRLENEYFFGIFLVIKIFLIGIYKAAKNSFKLLQTP